MDLYIGMVISKPGILSGLPIYFRYLTIGLWVDTGLISPLEIDSEQDPASLMGIEN